MKRIVFLLIAGSALFLTGCETTKEISLKSDGGGTFVTTTDMSSLMGMAKMGLKGQDLDKAGTDKAIDTSISAESLLGMFPDLSSEEQSLVKNGTLYINMDMKNDKLLTKMTFPFTDGSQIASFEKVSSKMIQQLMKQQMAAAGSDAASQLPPGFSNKMGSNSLDEYYTTTYSKGVIEKKLIAEKYATLAQDSAMQSFKELAGMGMGGNTIIYNLPSPAKKVEGKNTTLSPDKMKVTIENGADDFFDDGKKLEYRIEY